MKALRILPAAALLLAASAARAEGPVGPQEDLQSELAKASLRVSKALKDNEDALAKIARGESAEVKTVDIDLPKDQKKGESKDSKTESSSSSSSSSSSEGGGTGGALRGSEEHGKGVVAGIDELLKVAAKMSQCQGGASGSGDGSGGPKSSRPQDGDDKGDSGKPKNEKKGPDEKGDSLKDNKPEGDGKPEGGEKSKSQPNKKGMAPPSTPRRPTAQELKGIFLAKLPDKVREAVENGDFDQVPEKYRDLIREWTKALSEADKAETGGADAAK